MTWKLAITIAGMVALGALVLFLAANPVEIDTEGLWSGSAGCAVIALVIALYLLPACVALARKHHQQNAIALLNLLLGWTVLGWIGALIWSATAVRRVP